MMNAAPLLVLGAAQYAEHAVSWAHGELAAGAAWTREEMVRAFDLLGRAVAAAERKIGSGEPVSPSAVGA